MELPENITSHKELNREIQDIADDMWARIFALSLGVPCPNERAKALFINFVIKRRIHQTNPTTIMYTDYCQNL